MNGPRWDWEIAVEEVSAYTYRVTARNGAGNVVERTGTDLDALRARVAAEAAELGTLPMPSRPASRLDALLDELCAQHGWCGARREAERIRGLGSDVGRVVDAVLRAEGIAPETARPEDRALLTERVEDWLTDPAGRGARSGLP